MNRFQNRPLRAALIFGLAAAPAAAQLPPGVERDPAAARISVEDLDRFAAVHRRLLATRDTLALLDSAYMARASVGLGTYSGMYDVNAASLVEAIRRSPETFQSTAHEAPIAVRELRDALMESFRRLADLYPSALFPPVFFLVGRDHAGGAVQPEGILIAVETYAPTHARRSFEDLVHLVAHELTHFQQAAYDVDRYQSSWSRLARAIKEGVADYVAELLTGAHINAAAHAYGDRHEWRLWSEFRCGMQTEDPGEWFFTQPEDPERPNDLGYYVGYRIAAARYAREALPEAALAALLRVDDYEAFLRDSGYEALLEHRERRPFPECADSDRGSLWPA